jgi:hypothetical protein
MLPIDYCRHLDVEWTDANRCFCHGCGRVGEWDGFMVWSKRTARPAADQSAGGPLVSGGPLASHIPGSGSGRDSAAQRTSAAAASIVRSRAKISA